MHAAIEAMGMSLPSTAYNPTESQDKKADCKDAGEAVYKLLEKGIYPKDIMTKKAFENAITIVNALGGSTNAVLHLLAIEHAINVDLSMNDFIRFQKRVSHIDDLKPD